MIIDEAMIARGVAAMHLLAGEDTAASPKTDADYVLVILEAAATPSLFEVEG